MKKSQISAFLNDLKAAARLGHPEAVEMALEGLRAFPQVAANHPLGDGFIDQVILPAGKILSKLPAAQLHPLLDDPQTALRATAGVALAHRFGVGKDGNPKRLQIPAKDARPEVRTALAETLREVGEAHPERLLPLAEDWLAVPSARQRSTALGFIPALGQDILQNLDAFKAEQHPEVRAALVDALQALAQNDLAEPVLELLSHWGAEPRPNAWVIGRVLSGSWAASYPQEVKSILQTLHKIYGDRKAISNALKALQRHGVDIEL
jgi:hypothetical protein